MIQRNKKDKPPAKLGYGEEAQQLDGREVTYYLMS